MAHIITAEVVWLATVMTALVALGIDWIFIKTIPECKEKHSDGSFTVQAEGCRFIVHLVVFGFWGLVMSVVTNDLKMTVWPVWLLSPGLAHEMVKALFLVMLLLSGLFFLWGTSPNRSQETDIKGKSMLISVASVALSVYACTTPSSDIYKSETVEDSYLRSTYIKVTDEYKTIDHYTGNTLEQAVIYENDQNITVEAYVNGQWVDVSTITTPDQLPATDTTNYRVKRGYTTIDVPDITQTVIDTIDKKVAGITPEYIPYVKLRITKVIVATDERQHVIPTDETNVRSTDIANRIHIEYEVTNVADVQAMMKDKTSDEDALKQLITPKPKGADNCCE